MGNKWQSMRRRWRQLQVNKYCPTKFFGSVSCAIPSTRSPFWPLLGLIVRRLDVATCPLWVSPEAAGGTILAERSLYLLVSSFALAKRASYSLMFRSVSCAEDWFHEYEYLITIPKHRRMIRKTTIPSDWFWKTEVFFLFAWLLEVSSMVERC